MKTIYLEATLNLLVQMGGAEAVNNLVKAGKVKETEEGLKYLLIEEEL